MTPDRAGDLTTRFASALTDVRLSDVPARVVERARYLMLDGLACGLVGARLPWSRQMVDGLAGLEGDGAASVWGWGRSLPAGAACLLNSAFIQAFELDDYHHLGPLHSQSVVLPPALATAERIGGCSDEQFLLAVILGFEAGPRLGMAMDGFDMIARGWHGGAIYGVLSAAVAAATVRGLGAGEVAQALALAGAQASGLMGAQYEASVKRMQHGFAARSGLYAAAFAAAGCTGMRDVLAGEYGGFASTFAPSRVHAMESVLDGLGDRWELEAIAVKPYACMAGLHSTIDALLDMRRTHGLSAATVRSITIRVPESIYHHGGWPLERPATAVGAQMNLAYAAAVTLLDGAAGLAQFAPGRLDDDEIWHVIERVRVVRDDTLGELAGEYTPLAVDVSVQTSSGTFEQRVTMPRGSVARPLTNEEIADKAMALATRCTSPERWKAIERVLIDGAGPPVVDAVLELLRDEVADPLRRY